MATSAGATLQTQPSLPSGASSTPVSDANKGAALVKYLYDLTQTPTARATIAGGKVALENTKFIGLGTLSPAAQGVVITSVMVRKAMHVAGIVEPSEGIACVMAITKLGATSAVVTAKVGATTVVSFGTLAIPTVFIGLVVVALESYHVGNACFVQNGFVSHTLGK